MSIHQTKNLDNIADKAISDEELEQVSGGATITPQKCPDCQNYTFYRFPTYAFCENCGYRE